MSDMKQLAAEVNVQEAIKDLATTFYGEIVATPNRDEPVKLNTPTAETLGKLGVSEESLRQHATAMRAVEAGLGLAMAGAAFKSGERESAAVVNYASVTQHVSTRTDVERTLPNGDKHITPVAIRSRMEIELPDGVPSLKKIANFVSANRDALQAPESLTALLTQD